MGPVTSVEAGLLILFSTFVSFAILTTGSIIPVASLVIFKLATGVFCIIFFADSINPVGSVMIVLLFGFVTVIPFDISTIVSSKPRTFSIRSDSSSCFFFNSAADAASSSCCFFKAATSSSFFFKAAAASSFSCFSFSISASR